MSFVDYYKLGYGTFGPFLLGLSSWLREQVIANRDKKVFFFSRDGFMIQNAWILFEKMKPIGIEQSYAYFSRNSLRRALLWKCNSYEDSLKYLSKERFTDVANIASYYGLSYHDIQKVIDDVGLGWEEPLLLERLPENKKVRRVYELNRNKIYQLSYLQYKNILAYLSQIGMSGNCAIVDIGWNGSMQYYLEKIIETGGVNASINGYYVGMSQTVPIKGHAEGYIFSKGNLNQRKSVTCFFGVFEKFLQSFEGSTDSYKEDGPTIRPVLKAYEYEDDMRVADCIKAFQEGALRYVKEAINKNIVFPKKEDAYKSLIRFGKSPTYAETQMFRFFYNTDGEKQYFIPQKPIYKYRPKEFIYDLSNSVWKTGFMKAAFRIPFPYFWIYNLIRK